MPDYFQHSLATIDGPALAAFAVTPSDSADLAQSIRMLTIGLEGGTVSYVSSRDGQTYTTGALPVGNYAFFARRIRATGTTATGLTGWA